MIMQGSRGVGKQERLKNIKNRITGFTLIEIVVSLMILAIALPTLLQAFSQATRSQGIIENRTTALHLMQLKMSELEAQSFPELGQDQGEFGTNSRFRWIYKVTETPNSDLRQLSVTVTWQEKGTEKSITVNRYVANKAGQNP